jgi:hypothetical protein
MGNTANKLSPGVRARAGADGFGSRSRTRLALGGGVSISAKIGCSAHTLLEWVK